MKKIVALVLSLVLALGLATTAFAVDYDLYDANGNAVKTDGAYTVVDATPVVKGQGVVEYVTLSWFGADTYFVECAKADAGYYVTIADQDDAVMYLKEVKEVEFTVAKEFTNIGTACGQLTGSLKNDYYVTTDAKGFETYWKGEKDMAAAATAALLVNGELVQVSAAGDMTNLVAHDWEIKEVNAKHEVVSIVCAECDAVAKVYETKLAAPAGAIQDATYGWIAFVAAADAPAAGTVESAQTFDAGIAMYVGMSVMAAAGSAVVLKKKD